MLATQGHESKQFFIDGKMFLIEPFRGEDQIMQRTLREIQKLPNFYQYGKLKHNLDSTLNELCRSKDRNAEVLIATLEGLASETVAFAFYHLNETSGDHEMSMLVKNDYCGTRLPSELLESLILEATTQGVSHLYTTDSDHDVFMDNLAKIFNMSVMPISESSGELIYSLNIDAFTGIAKATAL